MAQRPEQDTTTPRFTVPDDAPGELALPEVTLSEIDLPEVALPEDALPAEGRRAARAARAVAPGSGPQARSVRPDRLAGRGQRAAKGRNYQFRRS
ncbi:MULTISPECIES: hypothetical protein [unclassified Micromonospora]|uniref:hypothetical protein n=1 Tax=unclassified Micromonospora TaxID=2617518 RepID=UPI003A842BE3